MFSGRNYASLRLATIDDFVDQPLQLDISFLGYGSVGVSIS